MTVIVGVDGSGRTHRLAAVAAAAGRPVLAVDPAEPPEVLAERLAAAGEALVVVDDADRLPAEVLRLLARHGRAAGARVAISRRPAIGTPELAELDAVAAGQGGVERLEPLDATGVAAVIRAAAGRPATAEEASAARAATAGLPGLTALAAGAEVAPNVALGTPSAPNAAFVPPALHARVQRQLALLGPSAGRLARVLALGVRLPDDVAAEAAGIPQAELPEAARGLSDAGLLDGDGEIIPVVAHAVLADVPPAALRELHGVVGRALLAKDADPVAAAEQLGQAGASAPEAFVAAGDRLRFADPETASGWYDRALATGADPQQVGVGRVEAAALLGLPVDPDATAPTPEDGQRLELTLGAVAAHQGRPDRCADALLAAGTPGPVLAVPALVSLGRITGAEQAAKTEGPASLRLFAEATLAVADPQAALPLLIEAAEAAERARPELVLPDTPHAVAAVVAVNAGDVATAEHLLARAKNVGGPVAATRHRLLLAWARMRTGRTDTATALLPRLARQELGGRERLLAAALSAGLARRTGDIGQLRAAWATAEPVLARQAVDLLQVEALEELLVAAARLRQHERVSVVLAKLDGMLDRWGRPPAWTAALGWVRLQVAVAAEDAAAAGIAAEQLAAVNAPAARQRAQRNAAASWAKMLADGVDAADAADEVLAAAERLTGVQLPWEGSRLAGAAAIRSADAQTARRLLERARELAGPESPADGKVQRGVLSEREVEVSRLVLAGRTHREIGAQLYVSPKTVEHHVARIRAKLGATSRAELQAALRSLLGESD